VAIRSHLPLWAVPIWLVGVASAQSPMPAATYARAEGMLSRNADSLVLRDKISPQWIAGSDRVWYRVATERGTEFIYVDPTKRLRRPAFDHQRLAAALAAAADTTVMVDSLPFQTLVWREEGKATSIEVGLARRTWRCELAAYRCDSVATPKVDPNELRSPDGKWALFLKDHNLWIRNTTTDQRRALTTDGTARNDYAGNTESNTIWVTAVRSGFPAPPIALWSADSRRVLVQRIDQRRVPESYLVQSVHAGGVRPKLWSFAFPMPGDSVAQGTWWIFEAESGRAIRADTPPMPVPFSPSVFFQEAWWADSAGTTAYYIEHERGVKAWWLKAIDAATGRTRTIAEERGPTLTEATLVVGTRPVVRVTRDGKEVIWFSERDGWAHLYLLDAATGLVKQQITKGPWVVRDLIKVDERARKLWFLASGREPGRDPYLLHLYSIGFDGTGLTLLTPEDAHHQVTLGARGEWVVDRVSRMDLAPVTVARSLDGKTVLPLERADLSRLLATGWRWPERFAAKAADGVTDVHGIIFKPVDFDSTRRYPVIEEIYPGPQAPKVPKAFEAGGDHRALVELGMIGVQVDGRGTPFRSKAFHDYSYGRLENGGGLEDHLAAFRQIAASRPYLDLDRVGIYGHSGGGFASARAMLLFPDFYQVAVSSAGNHDQRGYLSLWGETYHGMPQGDNYLAQANPTIAKNLKGKLMLAFGEMDDNVSPALTIQLIDALTKANKDYDLLIVPNGSHAMMANSYFRRRRWDYFVTHLVGATPPQGYQIKTPSEYPVHSGTEP
jgi:dipeptidyl-peptidase-4